MKGSRISLSGKEYQYTIKCEEVNKETVFSFCTSKDTGEEADQAAAIEDFDNLLHRINDNTTNGFLINTIWDDASLYYGKQLYPKISEIESLLRKVIYSFMFRISGSSWHKNIPPEVREKIENVEAKAQRKNAEEDVLYDADFIQLGYFLFIPYTLRPFDDRYYVQLKELLTGTTSQGKKDEFLEIYTPKSNWDRFLMEKIPLDNFLDQWITLYGYRNNVAHTKCLRKKDFDDASLIIDKLKPAFIEALEHVNNIEATDEVATAVKEVAEETITPRHTVDASRIRLGNNEPYDSIMGLSRLASESYANLGNGMTSGLLQATTAFSSLGIQSSVIQNTVLPNLAIQNPAISSFGDSVRLFKEGSGVAGLTQPLIDMSHSIKSITQPLGGLDHSAISITQPLSEIVGSAESITQPLSGMGVTSAKELGMSVDSGVDIAEKKDDTSVEQADDDNNKGADTQE